MIWQVTVTPGKSVGFVTDPDLRGWEGGGDRERESKREGKKTGGEVGGSERKETNK